jgi:hypothetical protein
MFEPTVGRYRKLIVSTGREMERDIVEMKNGKKVRVKNGEKMNEKKKMKEK